jgi:hypothetical protein
MTIALLVYVIGVLITWIYAGYLTGRQFHRIAKANPTQPIQVNWISVFYQGLVWPGFWASFVGEQLEKRQGPGPDIDDVDRKIRAPK